MDKFIKYIFFVFCTVMCINVSAQTTHYPDSSVLCSGKWYCVSISQDGVYKLSYNDFISMGAEPQEIDFDNISVFGNTGKAISETTAEYKYSDLRENAIYVNKNERYILFYAEATTSHTYNTESGKFSFSLHPYAVSTKYFITFDKNKGEKKRILPVTYDQNKNALEKNYAKDFSFHKREITNIFEGGRDWVGEKMLPTAPDIQIPLVLNDINISLPSFYDIRLVANSALASSFSVSVNNSSTKTLPVHATPVTFTGTDALLSDSLTINSANTNVNIHFNYSGQNDRAWLDYILINYSKKLNFNNRYLRFFSTDIIQDNNIKYTVGNVTSRNPMVWDVTDATQAALIDNVTTEGNNISFCVQANTIRTIIVLAGSSFDSPVLEGSIPNQNLHATDTAEFIIITHPDFTQQAERLADIHRHYDKIKVAVIDINSVYNEYSSGTKDFIALREFIRQVYNRTGGKYPENVLLFGDGTYDNKNILQYNNNFIPTYQAHSSFSRNEIGITSDDVLAAIGDNSTNNVHDSLFVGIGRMPAYDSISASVMVDKCERYIAKSDLINNENGEWRNIAMLTSDDADDVYEKYFINNAENIYKQIDETNPGINIIKVYEDAYKEYTSSKGATYPDASNKINDRIKKGCLLFNYLGHGSYDHLSSERLVTITDITSWDNYNKLCLMITSTCEFNRFDLAEKQAAGEFIVISEHGAGIGLIAAARKISSNDPINRNLHRFALERQSDGRPCTFGQIMKNAKNNTPTLFESERSITLLGDPALRLSLPEYNIRTLRINNSYYDTISKTMSGIDTMNALSVITVEGEITDFNDNKITDFNGRIQISLYDKKSKYYTLNNSNVENGRLEFEQQTNILHKGVSQVINGKFTHTFTVPKDIAYNYGKGKLSYYAQNDSSDATGYFTDFIIGGIDTNAASLAESRPEIRLYLNDTNFVSGGTCDENPELYAVIYDTIPINTVGSGLGHDITARLDNAANTFILNEYYTADINNPNSGYIKYPFNNLSEGKHTLTLKVWNIYNYSSEKTITFYVKNSEEQEIKILNYPNPFTNSTAIEVRHNNTEEITSATLVIYNQNGGVIISEDISDKIGTYTVGPVIWDGTGEGGAKVRQGMYFYSIIMTTDKGKKISAGNKMIFLNKR